MKSRFRNIFLVFGIVAVVIMLFTFEVSYEELLNNLKRAGIYCRWCCCCGWLSMPLMLFRGILLCVAGEKYLH